MQSDRRGFGGIKKVAGNRFANVGAQFVPRVALCEDVLGKTFRHKATISFLRHLKYDLIHTGIVYTITT